MNPRDLLRIARGLASGAIGGNLGRPRQTDLRRALSATYYAMFHSLALSGANMLVGVTRAGRSQRAWLQAYRALEHGHAKNQCSRRSAMRGFPPQIQDFGRMFVNMQVLRQDADYNPEANFSRELVLQQVDETEGIITRFEDAPATDRRAFSVYVLLRLRGG